MRQDPPEEQCTRLWEQLLAQGARDAEVSLLGGRIFNPNHLLREKYSRSWTLTQRTAAPLPAFCVRSGALCCSREKLLEVRKLKPPKWGGFVFSSAADSYRRSGLDTQGLSCRICFHQDFIFQSKVRNERCRCKWTNMTRKKMLKNQKSVWNNQEFLLAATKVTEEYGNVCGQGSELRLSVFPSVSPDL